MKSKLIKISNTHYIVVDDNISKKEKLNDRYGKLYNNGDMIYYSLNQTIFQKTPYNISSGNFQNEFCYKITHSTQTLEGVKELKLSDVHEALGIVNVEDLAYKKFPDDGVHNNRDWKAIGYIKGYNQALQDNTDKKYTEEDLKKAIEMARSIAYDILHRSNEWEFTNSEEEIIQLLQPKTQWNIDILDNGINII